MVERLKEDLKHLGYAFSSHGRSEKRKIESYKFIYLKKFPSQKSFQKNLLPKIKEAIKAYKKRNNLGELEFKHVLSTISPFASIPSEHEAVIGKQRRHLIITHELRQ